MMKAEILAPAGNIESLKTAVFCGADAVYFGLSEFNARIKADNFNFENLSEWVDFCHLYGVKVYLTLNTMIKNKEINKLKDFIYKAATSNVDAFIVTDIVTIELCKQVCPSIPLHFSTQFGIHNLEGARVAVELGAKRIILSRETTLDEIKRIKENLDVEIEAFVHGAMCVSFSGRCYLSSFNDGNSGNRGRCKQPCRLNYHNSITNKTGYYLSMKDLCLSEQLNELYACGVCSFKIEGRLKSPQYVGAAITAYKNAIKGKLTKDDLDNLKSTYSRVFTNKGYLYGKKLDLITSKLQNNAGLEVGKVEKIQKLRNGLNKVYFSSSRELFKGDGLKITYHDKEICGAELSSTKKEDGFYILYISKEPKIYSKVSVTFNSSILSKLSKKTIGVSFELIEKNDGEYKLIVKDEFSVVSVTFTLDEIKTANLSQEESIKSVLNKDSQPYVTKSIAVNIDSKNFIPRSILNKARKDALEKLSQERIDKFNKNIQPLNSCDLMLGNNNIKSKIACIVSSANSLTDKLLNYADVVIYQPYDYDNHELKKIIEIASNRAEIYFGLPEVCFENDIKVLYKTIELYNTSLKGVYGNAIFAKDIANKYNLDFFAGFGLNIANEVSANYFKNAVLSIELNKNEIEQNSSNSYIYAYGAPNLMTFVHCPNFASGKNCNDCAFDKKEVYYTDKDAKYIIKRIKIANNCYFVLISNKPISLSEFDLTDKNIILDLKEEKNIDLIIQSFEENKKIANTSTGHYLKGVL